MVAAETAARIADLGEVFIDLLFLLVIRRFTGGYAGAHVLPS
jgi:hypothetical protein